MDTEIKIRVGTSVKAGYEARAKAAGMTLSAWIRWRCDGDDPVTVEPPKIGPKLSPGRTVKMSEGRSLTVDPPPVRQTSPTRFRQEIKKPEWKK